jgi:hypothetical protein
MSSIPFSYRIVARRKDIKRHRRFAMIDKRLRAPPMAAPSPRKRKAVSRSSALRAFVASLEKEVRAARVDGGKITRGSQAASAPAPRAGLAAGKSRHPPPIAEPTHFMSTRTGLSLPLTDEGAGAPSWLPDVGHEQPIWHSLLKVLQHCSLARRFRDRWRLACAAAQRIAHKMRQLHSGILVPRF